jgi:Zn-dependent protease
LFKGAFVNAPTTAASPFDLHWRLFGIDFRVKPSFWIVNLIFGYFYVQVFKQAEQRLYSLLALWLVCAFFSILIHELGHVTVTRLFGARSNIVLHSMGGLAIADASAIARMATWQRIAISAAGPAFGLALFAFVEWGLRPPTFAVFPSLQTNRVFQDITAPIGLFREGHELVSPGMLVIMNLIWNLFNLLPIIPLDGGMIMQECVSTVAPRRGAWLAYGFSFLLAGAITAYAILAWMGRATLPYNLYAPFTAVMFGLMAFENFTAMQALAPAAQSRRHHEYEEKDW